jgi:hypothetical protein
MIGHRVAGYVSAWMTFYSIYIINCIEMLKNDAFQKGPILNQRYLSFSQRDCVLSSVSNAAIDYPSILRQSKTKPHPNS